MLIVRYRIDGEIHAEDPEVNSDLVDILNLNCKSSPLITERKAALESLIEDLNSIEKDNLLNYCQRTAHKFQAERDNKTPYVGILLWYLQSMIEVLQDAT